MVVIFYLRFPVRVRRRTPLGWSDLARRSQDLAYLASTLCRISSPAITAITTGVGDNLKRHLLAMIYLWPLLIRSPRFIWTPQGTSFLRFRRKRIRAN